MLFLGQTQHRKDEAHLGLEIQDAPRSNWSQRALGRMLLTSVACLGLACNKNCRELSRYTADKPCREVVAGGCSFPGDIIQETMRGSQGQQLILTFCINAPGILLQADSW